MAHNADSKKVQPKKTKQCDCGGELKWVFLMNNRRFVYSCDKCLKYFDKEGKIVEAK